MTLTITAIIGLEEEDETGAREISRVTVSEPGNGTGVLTLTVRMEEGPEPEPESEPETEFTAGEPSGEEAPGSKAPEAVPADWRRTLALFPEH